MPDEGVMDRPTQTGGGSGRVRRGRGGRGVEFGDSGSGAGSPADDDFDRLAGMLELIGHTLKSLIYLKPPLLSLELREQFVVIWPETEREIDFVVGRLRRVPRLSRASRSVMYRHLQTAGLAGPMLKMKERSLKHHLNPLGDAIRDYSSRQSEILTLPEDGGLIRRLLKWVKPASKVMNSVMGSVPAIVFPGKELVKEVKEHVEAGYEAAEIYRET
jgi:hypothetical protein